MLAQGVNEGDAAPDFELPEASETMINLKDQLRDGSVILIFYPADWGMMCTVEIKMFKSLSPQFAEHKARLLGICTNSTAVHRSFKEHLGIKFPLLSDSEGSVSQLYGVLAGEEGYLKGRCERAIFVIASDGTVRFKWVGPDPAQEPDYDKILEMARACVTANLSRTQAGRTQESSTVL